jgi:DNA-binding Lrp family transcriptional regulator
MLHRLLEILRDGEIQSLLEIAQKLNISSDMVLQMVNQLTERGYLQEIRIDCDETQAGCPDCPINNSCQTIVRHWSLTEKGRRSINLVK